MCVNVQYPKHNRATSIGELKQYKKIYNNNSGSNKNEIFKLTICYNGNN